MRKKAIINIQNKDNKCFLWSILRYLHAIQKNETRLTDIRKYENDLNFEGIQFSVKLKDLPKFENQNPNLPGINVFSVDDNNKIYPLRLSQKDPQKSIDLFLVTKDENLHHCLINNFSRLTRSQITSDTTSKIHICKKCLTHFTKKDLFEKHISYCISSYNNIPSGSPQTFSSPIIPVISFVICHLFFTVYFLSFILYSSLSTPIFVHLFSDYPLSFTSSHTTPIPTVYSQSFTNSQ